MRRLRLREAAACKPRVDQVELVGRQVKALAAAARDHEIAEAAGEQVGGGALLEPGIGLAHHLEHEAHVVPPHIEAALLGALGNVGQRLCADQVVVADLLGHHLEQQAVLVRRQWRGLAGVLDAGDRLLDGG